MIEEIIIGLVVVFGILPMIGNGLRGSYAGDDYKLDLKVGLYFVGGLGLFFVILFLIVGSIMHIAEDGPAIAESIARIFNNKEQ
jgi:hypothetical protein